MKTKNEIDPSWFYNKVSKRIRKELELNFKAVKRLINDNRKKRKARE